MGVPALIKTLYVGKAGLLGTRVERPEDLTDLDTLADVTLFTITGGEVLLTGLYGRVNGGNLEGVNTNLRMAYTIAGGAQIFLSTARNVGGSVDDMIFTITGAPGVSVVIGTSAGVSLPSFVTNQLILAPGDIEVIVSTATNTGSVVWTLHYVPLDAASLVVAA